MTRHDAITAFLDRAGRPGVLEVEEQNELAHRLLAGRQARERLDGGGVDDPREAQALRDAIEAGEEAREALLRHNLLLVISVANHAAPHPQGDDIDDALQAGVMGLARALDTYDVRRGYRLATYATYWIRHALQQQLGTTDAIHVPRKQREAEHNVAQTIGELEEQGGNASDEEVAARLGYTAERVALLRDLPSADRSLDAPRRADDEAGSEGTMLATMESDGTPAPDEAFERADLHDALAGALERLPRRERAILQHRFEIGGAGFETRAELGASLGISGERVRQIERDSLARLRDDPRLAALADA